MHIALLSVVAIFRLASAGWLYPEQVHLSWTENTGEIRATWVTYIPTASSILTYRTLDCEDGVQNQTWVQAVGASESFNAAALLYKYQFIHTAVMTGLSAQCQYEYYVGSDLFTSDTFLVSGRTPIYSAPFTDQSPTRFIVFGDWGIGPLSVYTYQTLTQEAATRNFDGILHLGDIAYDLDDNNGITGDSFLRMIQPIAANFPYMVMPGNHEDADNFTHYKRRFYMPETAENEGTNFFYSFNLGLVHVIVYNSEVYFSPGNADTLLNQLEWLKADLAAANENRENVPWIVVLTHHPLYCSVDYLPTPTDGLLGNNFDCAVTSRLLRWELEDLFYGASLDLYLGAHVHNYERDAAIYQNKTIPSEEDSFHLHYNPNAPVHIISGTAGNREGLNDPISPTPQLWARFLSNDWGYGRLVVFNETHLYWEQVDAQNDGEVIDYVWIVKTRSRYDPVLL